MRESKLYFINGLSMMSVFFVARIILTIGFAYQFLGPIRHEVGLANFSPELLFGIVSVITLFILNLYWFSKMVRGALKFLSGSEDIDETKGEKKKST
jgi:hypothetical protein